ncbi:MAG: glycosyltransferase family 9 protein [Terriglobales bacterium]
MLSPAAASRLLPELPENSEVLIARLRSLGDMVLETPAIAALHAWRPDLKIAVLVEPWCAPVVEGNPDISRLIFRRDFLSTARELRRANFPIIFNQHGGPTSALLTFASGSPHRVCWKGYQFSFLYNVLVPDAQEFFGTTQVHTAEHRISQLWWTGLPRGPIPRAKVFPQPDAIAAVTKILRNRGLRPDEPYAVLQPGGRMESMRWPVANFAEIARWLRATHGIRSIVNLGRRDEQLAASVHSSMRADAIIIDTFGARELIALLAGARLFFGNDSGPAHIAASLDRPCVVIFAATDPAQWHPWQVEHRVLTPESGVNLARNQPPFPVASISIERAKQACDEIFAAPAN